MTNRTRTFSQIPVLGDYKRQKVRLLREARGIPSLVDAKPIRDHLRWLSNLGFSDDALGRAAGVSHNAIRLIRLDNVGQRQVQITRAARIRALTHVPVPAQADTWVPAIGAIRRLHALHAIGYSTRDLAHRLAVPQQAVSAITKRTRIYGSTWLRIRDLYDQLSGLPGPSDAARHRAALRNLAAPLAWEGTDIDHPDAVPDPGPAVTDDSHIDEVLLRRVLTGEHEGPIPRPIRKAVYEHADLHDWGHERLARALRIEPKSAGRAMTRYRAKRRESEAAA